MTLDKDAVLSVLSVALQHDADIKSEDTIYEENKTLVCDKMIEKDCLLPLTEHTKQSCNQFLTETASKVIHRYLLERRMEQTWVSRMLSCWFLELTATNSTSFFPRHTFHTSTFVCQPFRTHDNKFKIKTTWQMQQIFHIATWCFISRFVHTFSSSENVKNVTK